MSRAVYVIRIIILIQCLFFIQHHSMATHAMGSDFYWKSLGNHRYELTLLYYRDCTGIPNPNSLDVSITEVTNSSLITSIKMNRVSIENASNQCSQDTLTCNPVNSFGSGFGVERHTYQSVIDFNSGVLKVSRDSGHCNFRFSYTECCRNSINTIVSGLFYNDAQINICNIDSSVLTQTDNSPRFANSPVWRLCCNQPFSYNNGAFDEDGDSLVFSVVPARFAVNNIASYRDDFDPITWPLTAYCNGPAPCPCDPNTSPQSGFCFDPKTGDMNLTPVQCNEVGVIVIKVDQYRRKAGSNEWLHIGFTHRDLQWFASNCNNAIPQFDPISPHSVCAGDSICISIKAQDEQLTSQNEIDALDIILNTSLPGAVLNLEAQRLDTLSGVVYVVREGRLCWQTQESDARPMPYYYSLMAKDRACLVNQISSIGSYFRVMPNQQGLIDTIYGPVVLDSASQAMKYYVVNSFTDFVYDWHIQNGTIDSGQGMSEVFVSWGGVTPGVLKLIAYHSGLCSPKKDTLQIIHAASSVNTLPKKEPVLWYPNPVHNMLIIQTSADFESVRLTDALGRIVWEGSFSNTLDLSMLTTGLYSIQFKDKSGGVVAGKLIKN